MYFVIFINIKLISDHILMLSIYFIQTNTWFKFHRKIKVHVCRENRNAFG